MRLGVTRVEQVRQGQNWRMVDSLRPPVKTFHRAASNVEGSREVLGDVKLEGRPLSRHSDVELRPNQKTQSIVRHFMAVSGAIGA